MAGKEPRPPKDWTPRNPPPNNDGGNSGGGTPVVADPAPNAA
jgi:cell division protease FtsH